MADDRDEFTLFDSEVDAFQHLGARAALVEIFVDVIELQIGVHEEFLLVRCRAAGDELSGGRHQLVENEADDADIGECHDDVGQAG